MIIAKSFTTILLFLAGAAELFGQEPNLSLNPNFHAPLFTRQLPNTPRVAVFEDQKVILFGLTFNVLNGARQGPLIRLNSDASVDTSFTVEVDPQSVRAVARQADGKYVTAVYGSSYKAFEYFELYRLTPSGAVDESFAHNARPDGDIRAITISGDGKILVGGLFSTWKGEKFPGLVRLNPDGTIDHSFNALDLELNDGSLFPPGVWACPVLDPENRIVVVGNFTDINGTHLPGVARLLREGAVDSSFNPSGFARADGFPTRGLALSADSIFIGGRLDASGLIRPVVKLNSAGVADPTFKSEFTGTAIRDLTITTDGIFAVADRVYGWKTSGDLIPGFPAAKASTGQPNDSNDTIFTIAPQADGKLLVSGSFTKIGDAAGEGVARMNRNGSIDAFSPGRLELETIPNKIAIQGSRILAAGDFERIDGIPRTTLASLNDTGALDSAFSSDIPGGTVTELAIQSGDRILVGQSIDPGLTRLEWNGTADSTFVPPIDIHAVSKIKLGNEKIYFAYGNDPQSIYDHESSFIKRLTLSGAEDTAFHFTFEPNLITTDPNLPFAHIIFSPGPQPLHIFNDGKVLVEIYAPRTGFKVLRFNADGSEDSSFTAGTIPRIHAEDELPDSITGPNGSEDVLLVRAVDRGVCDALELLDKRILLGGGFQTYNGTIVRGLVCLNPDGTRSDTFQLGTGAQWLPPVPRGAFPSVENMELLADGNVLLTGNFESLNGTAAQGLAVINGNGEILPTNLGLHLFDYGPVQPFPRSQLVRNPGGEIILAGRYGTGRPASVVYLTSPQISGEWPTIRIQQTNGQLSLLVSWDSGKEVVIERSDDLKTWSEFARATNGSTSLNLSPVVHHRFFRAHY
jgi:uncharacterized delta-60 repeat protein